ncbi:RidA family protein [Marivirga sp. S37H4]|uniref:RidA family protein n=1 Tax=Marivirga aurantiaca TaxID=2802615 RepID=A0A934WVK5_9BACT|nr:RidA family protein [Marivirga aurantiaca]MBK6263737.1 RidA family protein [Marivirga aurantiaca]
MKTIIISITLALSSCSMKLSTINNSDVYKTSELGFSQAVVFNQVIYGSGQVGWNTDYKLPEHPTFNNQFEQTLQNIEHLLQNQGCGWLDVLHLRFYVVDINASKITRISSFLKTTYPNNYAPATTLLGVSALARENLQIEIEFIAKIKKQ